MFSSKSNEDKEKDQEEIEEFKQMKNKEYKEKYKAEQKSIMAQEAILDFGTPPSDMPNAWVQFEITLVIPEFDASILKSEDYNNEPIMKVYTTGLIATAGIGPSALDLHLKLGELEIRD